MFDKKFSPGKLVPNLKLKLHDRNRNFCFVPPIVIEIVLRHRERMQAGTELNMSSLQ